MSSDLKLLLIRRHLKNKYANHTGRKCLSYIYLAKCLYSECVKKMNYLNLKRQKYLLKWAFPELAKLQGLRA